MVVRWLLLIPARLQHVGTLAPSPSQSSQSSPPTSQDSQSSLQLIITTNSASQFSPKQRSGRSGKLDFVDNFERFGRAVRGEQSGQWVVVLVGQVQTSGEGGEGRRGPVWHPLSLSLSPLLQHHLTQFYPGFESGQTWLTTNTANTIGTISTISTIATIRKRK